MTLERNEICYLITVNYTIDSIGQRIPSETQNQVYCNVQSVSATEFFAAGEKGLKAEYKLTVFAYDYNGEETVVYGSNRYTIYRTYKRPDEQIELYCSRKTGS